MAKITAATFEALLSLTDEERQALAGLMAEDELTVDKLSAGLTQALQDEAKEHGKDDVKQAEALKEIPAGVWAAHVLDEHDELIYNLGLIRDAAKETAATNGSASNVEGHYTMLIESIDSVVEKFLNSTAGSEYLDIIRLVASKTKKPSK